MRLRPTAPALALSLILVPLVAPSSAAAEEPNQPPILVVTSAEHVVGMGFRLTGTVHDPDAGDSVRTLVVATPFGNAYAPRPNASWSVDVRGVPTELGATLVTVAAQDGRNATASVDVLVDVVGIPIVIHDERIEIPAGLHVAPRRVALPARVLEGAVDVRCGSPPLCETSSVVVLVDADGATTVAGRELPDLADDCSFATMVVLVGSCAFTTRTGPGHADIAWAQAAGDLRLRITGVAV